MDGRYGAGNFVKMIHNGIEYCEMQLIHEVYNIIDVMNSILDFDPSDSKIIKDFSETNEKVHNLFLEWNNGNLES